MLAIAVVVGLIWLVAVSRPPGDPNDSAAAYLLDGDGEVGGDADPEGVTEVNAGFAPLDDGGPGVLAAREEDATLGSVTFNVQTVERLRSIDRGRHAVPVRSGKGKVLYLARVRWRNDGPRPIDLFCGGRSAVLVDVRGRRYTPDAEVMASIPGNVVCDALQPRHHRTISLVFRTPADIDRSHLDLWDGDRITGTPDDADVVRVIV